MKQKSLLLAVIVVGLTQFSCVKNRNQGGDDGGKVVATVNGLGVNNKEIMDLVGAELAMADRQIYDIKRKAIDKIVEEKILEAEAQLQGMTVEKMLAQFDGMAEKEVSPEEIEKFLKRFPQDRKLSKEVRDSIPEYVKRERVFEARSKFVKDLRQKANIQILITKPIEKRVVVDSGKNTPIGPDSAKVKVVVFNDFQCPVCSTEGRARLREIKDKYKNAIQIFVRNFPIEVLHPQAFRAAEASICAREQGKYWAFHDELFDNQSKLYEKDLIEAAKKVGAAEKPFLECLKAGRSEEVKKDQEDGLKYGVGGTPTFLINGIQVRSITRSEDYFEIIDEELAK